MFVSGGQFVLRPRSFLGVLPGRGGLSGLLLRARQDRHQLQGEDQGQKSQQRPAFSSKKEALY